MLMLLDNRGLFKPDQNSLDFQNQCADFALWLEIASIDKLEAFAASGLDFPEWEKSTEDGEKDAKRRTYLRQEQAKYDNWLRREHEWQQEKAERLKRNANFTPEERRQLQLETLRIASTETVPDLFPED